MALECGEDGCMMPIWSYSWSAEPAAAVDAPVSGADRLRFKGVVSSFKGSGRMLGSWAKAKTVAVMPAPVKRFAVQRMADRIQAGK